MESAKMDFLKLYADMEQIFAPFTLEERGLLFTAMMEYCFHGVEPEFDGNERFVWPVLRRHIDQCAEAAAKNRANGMRGGRPRKTAEPGETAPEDVKPSESQRKPAKPDETQKNPEKPKITQNNPEKPNKTLQEQEQEQKQKQEQEQEHVQEQEQEQEQEQGNTASAPADDGNVLLFDGSDLAEAVRRKEKAQELAALYLPRGRMPLEDDPRVIDLTIDVGRYGADRVEAALREASQADNRGGVSVKFYRSILEGMGKPKAKAAGDYQRRAYTEADFQAMEVNLDAP